MSAPNVAIQPFDDLANRGDPVVTMQEVEINRREPKTLQALRNIRLQHHLREKIGRAAVVRAAIRVAAFGRDNHLLPATKLPQARAQFALTRPQSVRLPECVTVSRVEEIATFLDKSGDET